jgi:hypothetical protein
MRWFGNEKMPMEECVLTRANGGNTLASLTVSSPMAFSCLGNTVQLLISLLLHFLNKGFDAGGFILYGYGSFIAFGH